MLVAAKAVCFKGALITEVGVYIVYISSPERSTCIDDVTSIDDDTFVIYMPWVTLVLTHICRPMGFRTCQLDSWERSNSSNSHPTVCSSKVVGNISSALNREANNKIGPFTCHCRLNKNNFTIESATSVSGRHKRHGEKTITQSTTTEIQTMVLELISCYGRTWYISPSWSLKVGWKRQKWETGRFSSTNIEWMNVNVIVLRLHR